MAFSLLQCLAWPLPPHRCPRSWRCWPCWLQLGSQPRETLAPGCSDWLAIMHWLSEQRHSEVRTAWRSYSTFLPLTLTLTPAPACSCGVATDPAGCAELTEVTVFYAVWFALFATLNIAVIRRSARMRRLLNPVSSGVVNL